ncbi:hypothetical protein Fmac_016900 [Flemingia macrophylla]|uniref:Rx N-terminal domain-containing protein n=1 Tax=Flemingia macrophylla TaxID=520843 RepID=A0ABD1MJF9_9FABA
MAAEFVGSALLTAFIQTAVDRLASQQVVDFFRGRKLDEKLLNRLKLELRSINVVLDDAELKQIQSQLVRDWLFEVKDVVHDAEDLLDEINYELTRCQLAAESEPQTFLRKTVIILDSSDLLSLEKEGDEKALTIYKGKLKHLRSLDLSETRIEKLPDSTCLLYNLQILKLNSCRNLVELPSKLHKLTNLHCLEFKDTKVRRMPMHLGKLKNLRVLSYFYVGESSEFGIEQLQGLNLHESLSIQQLDNIVNPSNALAANLKNKTHLEKLELEWEINHIPDDARKEKEVLENLQPSKHLKDLSIKNYSGSLPALFSQGIVDFDCDNLQCLPEEGLPNSISTLRIIRSKILRKALREARERRLEKDCSH